MTMERVEAGFPLAASAGQTGPTPLEIEVTQMFDEFRAPLLRYLGSFGLAAQDAEEVVQEVFLALFLHLRQGKSRANLPAWIFRVGHNLGLKRCLANRREQVTPLEDTVRPDPMLDPEQQAATRQRQKCLLAVVQALPEQDRRCLYLRAEGLRYRDITEVLGMSLGAVAQSLARSLERLHRADFGELA
jgi:RNA polymerase sigma-70 factor (ECF subfamily)